MTTDRLAEIEQRASDERHRFFQRSDLLDLIEMLRQQQAENERLRGELIRIIETYDQREPDPGVSVLFNEGIERGLLIAARIAGKALSPEGSAHAS